MLVFLSISSIEGNGTVVESTEPRNVWQMYDKHSNAGAMQLAAYGIEREMQLAKTEITFVEYGKRCLILYQLATYSV